MDFDKTLGFFVTSICAFVLAFSGYAIFAAAHTNGEVDYCFISMMSPTGMAPQYQLFGHRQWRPDRAMGVYATLEEAKDKADTMSCKLNAQ